MAFGKTNWDALLTDQKTNVEAKKKEGLGGQQKEASKDKLEDESVEQINEQIGDVIQNVSETTADLILFRMNKATPSKRFDISEYGGADANEKMANFMLDDRKSLANLRGMGRGGVAKMKNALASFLRKNRMLGDDEGRNERRTSVLQRGLDIQNEAMGTSIASVFKAVSEIKKQLKSGESLSVPQAEYYAGVLKGLGAATRLMGENNEELKDRVKDDDSRWINKDERRVQREIDSRRPQLRELSDVLEKATEKFSDYEIVSKVMRKAQKIAGLKFENLSEEQKDVSTRDARRKGREAVVDMMMPELKQEFPHITAEKMKEKLVFGDNAYHSMYNTWENAINDSEKPDGYLSSVDNVKERR